MTQTRSEVDAMDEAVQPVGTDHTHTISNGKTDLTFDELGFMQPGVARLMLEVSNRFSRAYHVRPKRRTVGWQISKSAKARRCSDSVESCSHATSNRSQ